jgi:HK97 gp10 family phage protein
MPRSAAFDVIALNMESSIDSALGRVAAAMVKEMRRRVPEQSGHLLDSIKSERLGRNQYRITAGGEATTKGGYDYANAIEFGTHHAPAEPFFYPSVRVTMGNLRQEVAAGVKKGTGG